MFVDAAADCADDADDAMVYPTFNLTLPGIAFRAPGLLYLIIAYELLNMPGHLVRLCI